MEARLVGQPRAVDGDEVVWITRCREGHRVAFEPLVRRYGPRAYHYALGMVKNPEDAHDLSQEAFLRAYLALYRFDLSRPFYPWFVQILRNVCLSHLRRRRPHVPLDEPVASTRRSATKTETRLWVEQGLERLDDKDREILILKEFQGFSYQELSDTLGIPRGTVMSRLYYARRRLRDLLKPVLHAAQSGTK